MLVASNRYAGRHYIDDTLLGNEAWGKLTTIGLDLRRSRISANLGGAWFDLSLINTPASGTHGELLQAIKRDRNILPGWIIWPK